MWDVWHLVCSFRMDRCLWRQQRRSTRAQARILTAIASARRESRVPPQFCVEGASIVSLENSYRAHNCGATASDPPQRPSFSQHRPSTHLFKRENGFVWRQTVQRIWRYVFALYDLEQIPQNRITLSYPSRSSRDGHHFKGFAGSGHYSKDCIVLP